MYYISESRTHSHMLTWQGCEDTKDGRQWLQNVNINIVIMDNMEAENLLWTTLNAARSDVEYRKVSLNQCEDTSSNSSNSDNNNNNSEGAGKGGLTGKMSAHFRLLNLKS